MHWTEATVKDTLRERLRSETRGLHEELDGVVSTFDLTRPLGFSRFLNMHLAVSSVLPPLPASHRETSDAIRDIEDRARMDLASLGYKASAPEISLRPDIDPLAITYLFAGSRLGNVVLERRWRASADLVVLAADRYFSAPSYASLWRDFCARTDRMRSTDARSDRVVTDAGTLFRAYVVCARQISEKKAEILPRAPAV